MSRSRSLNKLFTDATGDRLAEIIARTARLKSVEQLITGHLPRHLSANIEVAGVRQQTLTLICASSVIASRVRYLETELLKTLNSDERLPSVIKIRAVVHQYGQPDTTTTNIPDKTSKRAISREAAQLIEQTSGTISNPHLASALKRLARHGRREDN
ncbi:MAG: DciA family protein [Immundisolibacteraceae bacterium]|nr:DciA family protein [Immundisolibacteraceae bacterium]